MGGRAPARPVAAAGDLPTNSILLNRGDGSFEPRVDYLANPARAGALRSTSLADIDGDGDLDIVNGFSASDPGGTITILFNRAEGTYTAPMVLNATDPAFDRDQGWLVGSLRRIPGRRGGNTRF